MSDGTVTVTLTVHEARALRHAAMCVRNVFDGILTVITDDGDVHPLDSAAMAIEVELVCNGEAIA